MATIYPSENIYAEQDLTVTGDEKEITLDMVLQPEEEEEEE